uniref:Serpentine receptor class gamma n=1 Tax=Pristionchus pacificus TaxID=54126 RepID=A0A8R1YAI4_PRIPA
MVAFYNCHTQLIDVFEICMETILAVPSFAIYIFLFRSYVIRKPRILNDSFFTLYLVSAALSMAYFFVNLIFMRIPGVGIFCDPIMHSSLSEPTYLLSFPYFALYYLPYAMIFSNIAISLNRMCSVLLLNDFVRAWIYLTPIAVILIFILPLPLCWHLLISPAYYSDVSNGIGMNYVKIINYPKNSLISLLFYLSSAGIVTASTVITALRMTQMVKRHKKSEVSLLLVGALQSFGTLLMAAHALYMYNYFSEFLYQKRFVIVDYQCFCPAWTLLLLSVNVRKELRRSIRNKSNAVKSSFGKGQSKASLNDH